MENTNFIEGHKIENTDFEKVFFHLFGKEIEDFVKKSKKFKNTIIISSLVLILAVIIALVFSNVLGILLTVVGIIGLGFGLYRYTNLEIRSTLNKIGVLTIPFLHRNLQNKSVLVDLSKITECSNFDFPSLSVEKNRDLQNEIESFNDLTNNYPIILSSDRELNFQNSMSRNNQENGKIFSEEIDLIEKGEKLKDLITSTENQSASIPLVYNDNDFLKYLKEHTVNGRFNKLEFLKSSEVDKDLKKMEGIVDSILNDHSTLDLDELCINAIENLNEIWSKYRYTMENSIDEIMTTSQLRLNYNLYSISNNYYCPKCNESKIEQLENGKYYHDGIKDLNKANFKSNTKLRFVDPIDLIWKCPLCEIETSDPIAKCKLDDELFSQVYDKLFEEHFKERLDIYNNINDQKRGFAEKASTAFHQVLRESRTKEDDLKSKIRTIGAEIQMEQSGIERLNRILVNYKQVEIRNQDRLQSELSEIKASIEIAHNEAKNTINSARNEAINNVEQSTENLANVEREDVKNRDMIQTEQLKSMKNSNAILNVMANERGWNKRKGFMGIKRSMVNKEEKKSENKK